MIEGLPKKRNPKEPVLAKDWNMMIDAIEARTPQRCEGMELYRDRRGFFYRAKGAPVIGGKPVPLTIVGSRPRYIPAPAQPPAEGSKRFYIEWGTLNDHLANNWDSHFDISQTTYFFAKATLRTTSTLSVENWEIVTGPNYDSHQTGDWPVGAPRPSEAVYLIGSVIFQDESTYITNNGGGSILVSEHLTEISPGTGGGEVIYGKGLYFYRQTY
jgi:hypothetical protein